MMWHRILPWTSPKQKSEYNYGWAVIKRQPIWHTHNLIASFVIGLFVGFFITSLFWLV